MEGAANKERRMGGCPRHGLDEVRVVMRRGSLSAFNGYRWQRSRYSTVECFVAGCRWIARTKAGYVDSLKDATDVDMGSGR
jgi:hypothetical protein